MACDYHQFRDRVETHNRIVLSFARTLAEAHHALLYISNLISAPMLKLIGKPKLEQQHMAALP